MMDSIPDVEMVQWAKNKIVKQEFDLNMLRRAWERHQHIDGLPEGEYTDDRSRSDRRAFNVHFQVLIARAQTNIKMYQMIASDFGPGGSVAPPP